MEFKHRSSELDVIGNAPSIKRIYGDRYQTIYRCRLRSASEAWFYNNKARIFAAWGSASDASFTGNFKTTAKTGVAYPNQCLVENDIEPGQGKGEEAKPIVRFIYETLTGAWVNETADEPGVSESGLKTLARPLVAKLGTDEPYSYGSVGTETIEVGGTIIYLAGFSDQSTDRRGKFLTKWSEAGVIDISESGGPTSIPGTKRITITSQGLPFYPKISGTEYIPTSTIGDAADATKSQLEKKNDGNYSGFKRYVRTYLVTTDTAGTILGVKYTVPTKMRVKGVGAIQLISEAIDITGITGGDISGTRAKYKRTNPTSSWVDVTMTIEITAAPPAEVARAFDPSAVSCDIEETKISARGGAGSSLTFGSDTNKMTITGWSRAVSHSSQNLSLPGYYVSAGSPSKAGSLLYVAATMPKVTNNTVATYETVDTKELTTVTATGDFDATGYLTTGVVDQKPRPVLTTLDGTVFWEVIKWTAA